MLGMQELIIGGVILLAVVLFGRKAVLKAIKEGFSLKRDVEATIKEEKNKAVETN